MTKTTQEIIQQIASTLIEKAVLVLIFALAAVFGISLSPADPFTRRIIVLVAYILLLSFAVYAFTAKKPSELATNVYRPVFQLKAKTAIVIVAILGLIPVYWAFKPSVPYSMPELPIKIVNNTPTDVQIYSKAQFSVQVPVSPFMNQDLATGYMQLHVVDETSISHILTIPANGELVVWSEIIAPSTYRSFLEQGNTTIQIIITRADSGFLVKQDVPFDMNTLTKYYVELVVK
jgi:hypothetical protein